MFDPSTIAWTIRVNAGNAYKDTGLTTPAVADGDVVQGLGAVGASAISFTSASSSSGPKLKLNRAGGKAALYFDGGTPCTLGHAHDSTLAALQSGDFSFYIIARPESLVSGGTFLTVLAKCNNATGGLGTARLGFMFAAAEQFANFAIGSDGNTLLNPAGLTSFRTQAVCDVYASATPSETIYRHGIRAANFTSTPPALNTVDPLTIGGITGTTSYAYAGEIYEIFAIGRQLTNAERLNMDGYANATYGVSSAVALVSGNSMVYGQGGTPGTNDPVTLMHPYVGSDIALLNNGVSGEQTPAMTTRDASLYIPSFGSAILNPVVHVGWEGYNFANVGGATTQQSYSAIVAWAKQSRMAGCAGVVVCSWLPNNISANETVRQVVRALLLADFTISTDNPYVFLAKPGGNGYGDVFYDVGNDYFLGAFGENESLTYYAADTIHPNPAGNAILAYNFAYAVRVAMSIAVAAKGAGMGFVRPGVF